MGKFTILLLNGANLSQYPDDESFLTRLRRCKREGGLKRLVFTPVIREFNTRKQADIYLEAVRDINSPDVFVTDNPQTIKEYQNIIKEIHQTFLVRHDS